MKKCFQLLALQTGKLLFLVFLLLFAVNKTAAQDSAYTAPGFPLGVFSNIENQTEIDLINQAGINYIVDDINNVTGNTSFNLMGHKESNLGEYIFYYTKGYYTRWEAERDKFFFLETGFKHPHPKPPGTGPYLHGEREYYKGAWSWATDSTSEFKIDSVLWGPNYRQDKNYTANFSSEKIEYTADYRLALSYDPTQYEETDTVAALSIVYRYKWKYLPDSTTGYKTDTLEQKYLTVFDFPADSFKTFSVIYKYPARFKNKYLGKFPEEMYSETDTIFDDMIELTGIEFQLDWYGVGKLYIDYVDLYDNIIGWQFQDSIRFENFVKPNLMLYADSYSNVLNLKYWYVNDEPNTMDSYEPMRIVDSIVTKFASFKRPIITEIYPHWNGYLNGDLHLKKFVDLTKPKPLMIDKYPFGVGYSDEFGLKWLRVALQFAHEAQPGFWYVGQAFSESKYGPNSTIYCNWRRPDSSELNSSIMLALAHGAKGIMLWLYIPHYSNESDPACDNSIVYFTALLDANSNPTDLYLYVKNDLSPRLKGKLGKTLLTLKYSGDYIKMLRNPGDSPLPDQIWRYFTLFGYGNYYYWQAGFLNNSTYQENKFVMLVNLRTEVSRTAKFRVENTTNYENLSARNIEGGAGELDTTIAINSSITVQDEFPPGEGKLYQFSPVVKYGGRLVYDETVGNETLYDDMIIENGATLTVNGDYYIRGDVIIKNGNIVTTGNGKLHFQNSRKLIIKGLANINGTPTQKLTLDFVTPNNANGIVGGFAKLILHKMLNVT